MKFSEWIDTLIEEKNINTDRIFEIEGASGINFIPVAVVIEHIKIATKQDQEKIKNMLIKIDFINGDICHFLNHLAGAIAK